MSRGPYQDFSTALGTSQITALTQAQMANATALLLANPSATGTAYVNMSGGTAAANGAGTTPMAAGTSLLFIDAIPSNNITAIGSTTGMQLTAQIIQGGTTNT